MKKKKLITSALPYVNNIPHLGNIIQVLSADVFARFCRSRGYETLYICGTDEYGTATETKALEEGITPKELCDRYYKIHAEIYRWLNIAFDRFGRTSTPKQTEITQDVFLKLDRRGYIIEKTITQLFCDKCSRFLADRYVRGTCPVCGYEDARGDQCENCGKLLDPTDLIEARCGVCGSAPAFKETDHLYIDLPGILPELKKWMKKAVVKGFWARNAVQMTKSWIKDGLKERCITRDLEWGIPVPKDGYRNKVFYVWFDAPIGYISMSANHTDKWESWWRNPDEVELYQFLGKDNIPFHTVIFPSSLIGSGDNWTLLHHMSSTEYLNYESGKFSKSKGIGVFGTDIMDTGIPADVWRFYIFYNRPEKSDTLFTWKAFQEKVNSELIGNFANLVNRTLTFLYKSFEGKVPEIDGDKQFKEQVQNYENSITNHLERAELRDAFKDIFALSSMGNKAFQEGEPWKTVKTDPDKARVLLRDLIYLVRDLGILIFPYLPEASGKIACFLNNRESDWEELGKDTGITSVQKPEILFKRLEDDQISGLREKFSGTQKERALEKEKEIPEEGFKNKIDLRVAKITAIERHPDADKLYIETVDMDGEERRIVSGLVSYYTEDELLGRNVILAANLKPAKLRGIKSNGMLLAAEQGDTVEVLFADHAESGERVFLKGRENEQCMEIKKVDIDTFFSVPLTVKNYKVFAGNTPLICGGKELATKKIKEGEVG